MQRTAMLATFVLLVAPLSASGPEVELVLTPATTLPSISVEVTVSVTNRSVSPVEIPDCMWMVGRSGIGEEFELRPMHSLPHSGPCHPLSPEDQLLAPNEVKLFNFDGLFLEDPRLYGVGSYTLHVVLADHDRGADWRGGLVSNDATLTVRFLNEADREAWKWINQQYEGWGNWLNLCNSIGHALPAAHPESNYVTQVVGCTIGVPHEEKVQFIEDAIKRFPNSPNRPRLMLDLAQRHHSRFRNLRRDDFEKARAELQSARAWATRAAGSESPTVRKRAMKLLEELPLPEEMVPDH